MKKSMMVLCAVLLIFGFTGTDAQALIISDEPPIADFSANPKKGPAPLTVNFTDKSTWSKGWDWDFGDGSTSNMENPSHTYTDPGVYTVSLTAHNNFGSDKKKKKNYIEVAYVPGKYFYDVPPGYWAEEFINKIYEAGITSGCSQNPPMYCPEDPVARAEMAVFLERGINGGDYDPPGATGIFDDCPVGYWAADWVEQFYADGITSGCSTNPPMYCPDDLVTRAQMAVFLLRSMNGEDYIPPSAEGIFEDVSVNHWAADWIEALSDEGISGGCSTDPPLYCPDDVVNRAQMAVFIVRAFGL